MKLTIAVDPGKSVGGCAVFIDGRLVRAELVSVGKQTKDVSQYAKLFARQVADFTTASMSHFDLDASTDLSLVCEDQVNYPPKPGMRPVTIVAKANDLLFLSKTVGACEAVFERHGCTRIEPNAWKASVPPDALLERVPKFLDEYELRIWNALVPRFGKSAWDHPADAVGLGLFHVGRAARGMVRP